MLYSFLFLWLVAGETSLLPSSPVINLLDTCCCSVMWHSITLLLLASLYLLQFGAAGTVPSIVANPAKLAGAGTWVEISWSGMKPELNATNDVLAIYADVQANVNDLPPNHDPLYYVVPFVNNPIDFALGKGSFRFYLVNIMVDLQVLYLRGKSFRLASVVASLKLPQTTPNIPLYVHLSPTARSSSIKAIWSTRDRGRQPTVRWGAAPGRYQHRAIGSVTSFAASDLCSSPANSTGFLDPQTINSAVMSNLQPNTRYYYSVGDAVLGYSQQFSFLTPPMPQSKYQQHYAGAAKTAANSAELPPEESAAVQDQGKEDTALGSTTVTAAAANVSSSGGTIQTSSNRPFHPGPSYYPGRVSSCSKRPYARQCRDDLQPMHMLAWADMGAFSRDNSRWVLGTFGDQIGAAIGNPMPGIELSVISALEATLGVLAANGAWVTTNALVKEARKGIYHAAALNGDIAYAFGDIARYLNWLHLNQEVLSQMPLLVSPGNHEADDPLLPYIAWPNDFDSGGECGVPYTKLFQPPNVGPRLLWYSTDVGLVHFLQISSEQAFWPGTPQYDFIRKDLQAVDRTKTPWVIAGFHRPLYVDDPDTSAAGNVNVSSLLRTYLEPLFVKYQVDMTWTGHIHFYHRTCPVIKGNCVGYNLDGTAKAPVHVVMGNAGGAASLITFPEVPNWMEAEYYAYGYTTVNVTRTRLTVKSYASSSPNLSPNGDLPLRDEVTLYKPLNWRPNPAAAAALYASTPVVPPQPSTYSVKIFESIIARLPAMLETPGNIPLLLACFGPGTDSYRLGNQQKLPLLVEEEAWAFNAALLTFLKAKFVPAPTDPPSYQATLDFAYEVVVTGRWKGTGTLPPACKL